MSETTNVIEFTPRERRRPARKPRPHPPTGTPLAGLIPSWELALRTANKANKTIELYLRTARCFVAYLTDHDEPNDAESITAEEIRRFLLSEKERTSAATAKCHHSYLSVWFSWMIAEEERTTVSPVLKTDRPHVTKKARKYLALEEIGALLKACAGSDFASRRDTAIIRVFIDNGMRISGLTGLRLDDVDLRGRRLRIRLKGGDEHWAPIGDRTAQALDRYLRVRARHPMASSDWLWLGVRSRIPLRRSGVQDMLLRRGEQAGVDHVHPHRFRGTSAHEQLKAGANPDEVRRVLGWKSHRMLFEYTEELANERARDSHAQFSPGDRV